MRQEEYKIYFRIKPFRYFLAKDLKLNLYVIVKKRFDQFKGYYYEEI